MCVVQLLTRIKMLTGVVEVGLFCHMAKAVYFGNEVRLPLTLPHRPLASHRSSKYSRITWYRTARSPQNGTTAKWRTTARAGRPCRTLHNLRKECLYVFDIWFHPSCDMILTVTHGRSCTTILLLGYTSASSPYRKKKPCIVVCKHLERPTLI